MTEESSIVNKIPGHTYETTEIGHNHKKESNYTPRMACESLSRAKPCSHTCIVHYNDDVDVLYFPPAGIAE